MIARHRTHARFEICIRAAARCTKFAYLCGRNEVKWAENRPPAGILAEKTRISPYFSIFNLILGTKMHFSDFFTM
jgi:hypothetical protein